MGAGSLGEKIQARASQGPLQGLEGSWQALERGDSSASLATFVQRMREFAAVVEQILAEQS